MAKSLNAQLKKASHRPFSFLGFRIEPSKLTRQWFVIDWDYESESTVGIFSTKERALDFCVKRTAGLD